LEQRRITSLVTWNSVPPNSSRSRNNGAIAATGEVVIFLDAHCEVAYNWLPPLLAPIHADRFGELVDSKNVFPSAARPNLIK
jgi:hypothetical protein